MTDDLWDRLELRILDAIREGDPIYGDDLPGDFVKSLVQGFLSRGYITQTLPGCDRYHLTLTGRAHLKALANRTATRKAA